MGNYIDKLDSRMQLIDKKRYRREQYQSFMTASEWRNVEIAEEFAKLLRDNKSMFQYPYFRQIFDVWKIAYYSYAAARKYNSIREIIFSEYILMDLLIATFSTMELLPRGIISLFLAPFLNKENPSAMQRHLAEFFESYIAKLQTIPFYDHPYHEIRADLAEKYKQCDNKTWVDWFSWKIISCELWAREWISKPLKYWFHLEGNETEATTELLVKFDAVDVDDKEQAKRLFQEHLAKITPKHQVTVVDEHIYAKDQPKIKEGQSYTSVYARLSAPRYAAFSSLVVAFGEAGIHLRKIAGQDRAQVKCTIDTPSQDELLAKEEALNKTKKVDPLYTYSDRIHHNRKVCLFDAPVRNLHKTLERLEKQEEVTVSFIHNF